MRWWISLAAAGVVAGGCQPLSNVCDTVPQPLSGADGGALVCARAEDCPRQAETFVCTTDRAPQNQCVSCEQNQCVLHVAVPCP